MRDMIRGTWFATVMLVASIVGIGIALGWMHPSGAWINVAIVMLVAPPTWWWMIARRGTASLGKGALAGALCAALVFLVPVIFLILTMMVRGFGQGDGIVGILALAGMSLVAIPLGAMVGAITVAVQRRWSA